MEKTNMKVNPLPSITWHWLKMNDSELEISLPEEAPDIALGGEDGKLRFISSLKSGKDHTAGNPDDTFAWPGWSEMETGMGEEYAQALRGEQTAFMDIPDGYGETGPAVVHISAPAGKAAGQILIHAGAGSETSVVITIEDETEAAGGHMAAGSDKKDDPAVNDHADDTVALQLLIHAEADAHLRFFIVQSLSMQSLSCLNIGGVCEERAGIELTDISFGAQKAYIGIAVKLNGEESTFRGDMGYRVKQGQDVDINYVARHIGSGTVSHMNAWGVLEEGSRKLFRGTIDFHEGCPGSKGAEKEDVLLLGDHQVNQTIPLILCHEEDVEGDHGATISRLDDQVLFYLGSRGLDAKTAEEMIAQARLDALISRIPDEEVRHAAGERAAMDNGGES